LALKISRGSGNVFRDVGFSKKEAAQLLIRSDLLIALREEIRRRRLTQAAAAKLLGVHQPRVSDLIRARLDRFSIETSIDMLTRLGVQVRVTTSPGRRAKTTKKAG
jgi:predicted XRE-type DNA-binding protein